MVDSRGLGIDWCGGVALFDPSCWVSCGLSRDQFHFLSLLLCWTAALVYLKDRATEYRNAGVIKSVWRFRVLNGGSGFSTRPNSNRQIPSTAKSNSPQTKPYNVWVPARIPGAPVLHPFLHTCSWAFLPLVLIISHVATNQQRGLSAAVTFVREQSLCCVVLSIH